MRYIIYSFYIFIGLLLASCEENVVIVESTELNSPIEGTYSYSLHFDAPYPHYDGEDATRATEAGEWEDGDEVYIYLDNPIRAYAKAVYNATIGTWVLNCDKQLVDAASATCIVWYGKQNTQRDHHDAGYEYKSLSSAFYSKNGSFSVDNNKVYINVTLKPYGCRIRLFNEDVALRYNSVNTIIYNVKFLSGMNLSFSSPFSYYQETEPYSQVWYFDIEDSNYSRYHVLELSKEAREIILSYWNTDLNYCQFSRYFDDNILKEGESGCYTLPTRDNPRGWTVW